mmetsp:Transcript_39203/g.116620  ORF Transcript_39203/g.116620 Transcript_39203/m.116620 type:complete len:273 (+) Transcript_39203:223-1041(+)
MCSAVRLSENVTSGSMPACSRRLMYMTLPSVAAAQSSMAAIRLLSPSDAWASRKILMHWSWPFCAASSSGTRPKRSASEGSAPVSSSSWHMPTWPSPAAMCSAVRWSGMLAVSGDMPWLSIILTSRTLPLATLSCMREVRVMSSCWWYCFTARYAVRISPARASCGGDSSDSSRSVRGVRSIDLPSSTRVTSRQSALLRCESSSHMRLSTSAIIASSIRRPAMGYMSSRPANDAREIWIARTTLHVMTASLLAASVKNDASPNASLVPRFSK